MNTWNNNLWQQPPPSWFPPNPHPHVYVPPQSQFSRPPAGYWDQSAWNRPPGIAPYYNEYRAPLYPNLNPILAADTTLVHFNVQTKPPTAIQTTTYYANRQVPATANPVTHMRLFSKSFPWSIDIMSTPLITCEIVWDAIYTALQHPLADSEWALIIDNEDCRRRVEKAAKKRRDESGEDDKVLKRIDWLGEKTLFKGLEKDSAFQKNRLLPGSQPCPETWVVKFGAP